MFKAEIRKKTSYQHLQREGQMLGEGLGHSWVEVEVELEKYQKCNKK